MGGGVVWRAVWGRPHKSTGGFFFGVWHFGRYGPNLVSGHKHKSVLGGIRRALTAHGSDC
jgi:hypothetical protein